MIGIAFATTVAAAGLAAFAAIAELWRATARPVPPRVDWRRLAGAAAAATVVAVLVGWPVLVVAAGAIVCWWPALWGSRAASRQVERSDAIASWLEALRDSIRSGRSPEQSVQDNAAAAPLAIRGEAMVFAEALAAHVPLGEAATNFATACAHPTADLAAAAVALTTRGAARLPDLFDQLAVAARQDAAMHRRIDAERRRTVTAERVILGTLAVFAGIMLAANRPYLTPYDTVTGQLILAAIAAAVAVGMGWIRRLARYDQPQRFLVARTDTQDWAP
jgi:Flp pilus assembly protein TadB